MKPSTQQLHTTLITEASHTAVVRKVIKLTVSAAFAVACGLALFTQASLSQTDQTNTAAPQKTESASDREQGY